MKELTELIKNYHFEFLILFDQRDHLLWWVLGDSKCMEQQLTLVPTPALRLCCVLR